MEFICHIHHFDHGETYRSCRHPYDDNEEYNAKRLKLDKQGDKMFLNKTQNNHHQLVFVPSNVRKYNEAPKNMLLNKNRKYTNSTRTVNKWHETNELIHKKWSNYKTQNAEMVVSQFTKDVLSEQPNLIAKQNLIEGLQCDICGVRLKKDNPFQSLELAKDTDEERLKSHLLKHLRNREETKMRHPTINDWIKLETSNVNVI
ncbi:hypothetical protein HELRODRAFT_183665 [Helobdella robusta]|uniref:Uncharacterized protein n=1 Tax=Helobdella robusta TaxID=6412 RepID=T1FK04_HELRO|nr:hypothetical protein HELRODRAFT_183665 [Helobdella robusta]ESO10388.1 hypothetical protein HELRODRAFT_183665 [Helobdella robusta]